MAEGKINSNCFRIFALTYIAIHHSSTQLPENLQLILFFIRQLQTIAFLVLKQLDQQVLMFNYTIQSSLYNYQYILVCFILITVILYCSYLLLITYVIQVAVNKSEIQESLLNRMLKQKLYTIIGNNLLIWVQEALSKILFLPFFYALLLDINGKDGNPRSYLQFLDILCIILIILIYVAYLMFLEQSLDFSKHQFQRITNSSIHYLIIILEILQVACATIDKSNTIFYFVSLFQFSQIFLTIYDIFINYSLVNLKLMQVILFALSIQLTVLGTVFTIYLGDFQQNYYLLIIILVPITYQLFIQTLNIHIFQSILSNNLDVKQQTFQMIYILTHHKKFRQFRALLFGKHRSSCFKLNCHCKQQFRFDLYDSANNYFFNFLKRNVVVKLGKSIDTVRSEDLSFFFHYIIALNELGFTTQAFQQISFIQSADRRKMLKSLNGSMFNTYSTEQRSSRASNIIKRLESSQSHPEQVNHDEDEDQDSERKPVEMNFIEACRFEILSQIIRQSMSFNIGSSSQDQINTQHMVSLFILQENNNLKVTNTMIQIFKGKISYLKNLATIDHNQLKNSTQKLNNSLHKLHKSLLLRYEHFPSHKLQLTLGFVQAELMNNYYLAYKTMNVMSIKDEKIFDQFDTTHGINFFSKNVSYLICEYETNSYIKIANFSPNSPKFFDYKLEEFKKLDNIDYLLPPTILTVHEKFVSKFLQTGQSKYFSNCESSYCMNNSGAVECVQMLYDINYQDSKAFSFIIFLQKTKPEQVMFVSEDGIIGGVSDKLVQQFGYKSIGQEELRNLYKTKIKSIIPSFQDIIELAEESQQNNSLTLKYSNIVVKERVQINFPSPTLNHMPTKFESFSAQSKISLKNYLAVIRVYVQNIKGRTYYLINFLDIRNIETQSYATSHVSDQFDKVWSLSDASSPPPNQPKILELKQAFASLEDQIRIYIHQPIKLEMVPQDQLLIRGDQDDDFYNSLISQNRGFEQTGIIDKTQQQFFGESYRDRHSSFVQNNIEQSSNIISDFQKSSNAIDQLLLKDILQCFPKQLVVKESKQIYDNNHKQSEVTASGFRSSKYFWKYTFFNRLTQERLQVSEFSKSFILLLVYFMVCLACTIMIFVITQVDFDDIQQQMRLIYTRNTIMSPISRSLLTQIIDREYNEIYAAGIVDQLQYNQMNQYIVARNQQEFDTLKSNLLGVIEDPKLAQFFKDLNDEMYISDDSTQAPLIKVQSFRTQLINIVTSQLAETESLIHGIKFPTANFENFGLANYDTIFNLIEALSDAILIYTQSLANNYNTKTILITIIFIFISVLIITISFGYQFSVIRFYEKTFELRMFIQKDFLQKEIDRLVLLSTMIENNRNLIQHYQFKLIEKEEYLQYLEKARPVQDKFMKQNVILSRSRLMTLLSHLIVLCIFMSFTLGQLISSNSFFNDFNPTLEYLFDMSEIVSIINSAYVANELSYFANSPNYAFLGNDAKTNQKEIITLSVNRLNVFLGMAYSISTLSIINGERFKTEFQLYASNDVCAVFNSTYIASAGYVCQYSIDGNLRLGFVPSIIFMQKIFQQDLQISNFIRTVFDYPINQIEATLVIGDCMDLLSSHLFDDVSSYTDSIQILKHVVSGVHLFYLMIFLFLLWYNVYQRAYRESYQIRQYLSLNPIYTMILENQFERAIRSLVLRQEWL